MLQGVSRKRTCFDTEQALQLPDGVEGALKQNFPWCVFLRGLPDLYTWGFRELCAWGCRWKSQSRSCRQAQSGEVGRQTSAPDFLFHPQQATLCPLLCHCNVYVTGNTLCCPNMCVTRETRTWSWWHLTKEAAFQRWAWAVLAGTCCQGSCQRQPPPLGTHRGRSVEVKGLCPRVLSNYHPWPEAEAMGCNLPSTL